MIRNPAALAFLRQRIGLLFALAAFLLLALTAGQVGVTWDEPIYAEAAERAAHWLGWIIRGEWQQAFDPTAFGLSWGLVNEHPPLLRVVDALGWALSRAWLPAPLSHRLGSIGLAAVGLGLLVGFVTRRRGLAVGLFAGAAALSMPRLFFHAHLAALDFPLAVMWMLATLFFYQIATQPRLTGRGVVALGVVLGLALLTKINAVLLLPFWALWIMIFSRRGWLLALALPVALLTLYLGWPWMWKTPLTGFGQWLHFFQQHYAIPQWFAGRLYTTTPWYLPLTIVLLTTPLLLLLLAGVGALTGLLPLRARRQQARPDLLRHRRAWIGLHLLGAAVVLGYYALPTTGIHDQERLLLPVSLHLAVLAGEGYAYTARHLIRRLTPRMNAPRLAVGLALAALPALLLGPGAVDSARLHPYQLAYYNAFVGGAPGAQRLELETIYFASTYAHFLPQLNALPAGSRVWVMPNSYDVLYYYQRQGRLRSDLALLRPSGWGSFYDDAGVPRAEGWIDEADAALIERRQTAFNTALPAHDRIMAWASYPELARLERSGVLLATLHSRP